MFENIKAYLSFVKTLALDNRGEAKSVISLFVAVFLFAILMPIAFDQIFGANTTGWSTSTVTLWTLIPLLAIVGMVLVLIYKVAGR